MYVQLKMVFPFTINGEFVIDFIIHYYNTSICENQLNQTTHKINCDEYQYSEAVNCCNNYIQQQINNNNIVDVCYNNSNLNYQYECKYVKNPDWYLGILSFMFFIWLCVCCIVIKCKKDEKEESRMRLISNS